MNPKSLFIALFTSAIILSCEPTLNKNTATSSTANLPKTDFSITNKTWKITLINSEVITGEVTNFYLRLNTSTNTFESKAGCNQITGEFKISNQLISFSKIVSTKMYCIDNMKIEEAFLSILSNPSKFKIIDSSKLVLFSDAIIIAQFELVE